MYDYIRITGSCSITLVDANKDIIAACLKLIEAAAPARKAAGVAPATIAINYSPWYEMFKGNDPTVEGDAEKKELTYYGNYLRWVGEWLGPDDQDKLGAVLLDMEKWSGGVGSEAVMAAATRKADLIYNATIAAFPHARIEMYGRGAVTGSDRYNHYTLDKEGANITNIWTRGFRCTPSTTTCHVATGSDSLRLPEQTA